MKGRPNCLLMSACGTKQTGLMRRRMSASGGKADIGQALHTNLIYKNTAYNSAPLTAGSSDPRRGVASGLHLRCQDVLVRDYSALPQMMTSRRSPRDFRRES